MARRTNTSSVAVAPPPPFDLEAAQKQFAVVIVDGQELQVALTPEAARYKVGIIAAKTQKLIMDQLEKFSESSAIIAPGELDSLVKAAAGAAKMQLEQFGPAKGATNQNAASPINQGIVVNIGEKAGSQPQPLNVTEVPMVVDMSQAPAITSQQAQEDRHGEGN